MDDLETIGFNKTACTGADLTYESPPNVDPVITSKDGFDSLVSEYYKFFRETLAADIAFLRGVEGHRDIRAFDDAIYQLRTAKQHDDNVRAVAFYENWTSDNESWQIAGEALSQLLQRALAQLARISSRVRRDVKLTSAWRERASAEPASVFESVCTDLNASFGEGRKQHLIRNIERKKRRILAGEDVRAAVESFCVEEITHQSNALPVPYYEVLDRLDLIGRPRARAAILLAYSVSASTRLRGEEFLGRVEEAWKVSAA